MVGQRKTTWVSIPLVDDIYLCLTELYKGDHPNFQTVRVTLDLSNQNLMHEFDFSVAISRTECRRIGLAMLNAAEQHVW